jgi:uncharacterized protein YeaO (DUF488 family)
MTADRIRTKRVYDPPEKSDGYRVLVDRLWPRGISREKARVDEWLKEIAPSSELRNWYGHDPEKWKEFKSRYFRELGRNRPAVGALRKQVKKGKTTLLYASREREINNAAALKEYLAR